MLLLALGAVLGIFSIIVLMVDLVVIGVAAPQMAYALGPVQYPGSQLVNSYNPVGTESKGEQRTYRTSDSLKQVRTFMEEQMPGFVEGYDPTLGTTYTNFRQDMSALAVHAADWACSSLYCTTFNAKTYPAIKVTLYKDPGDPSGTLIIVAFSWPAP